MRIMFYFFITFANTNNYMLKKNKIMTKLLADSGSTKTRWCVEKDGCIRLDLLTQGINPFHMSQDAISSILTGELLPSVEEYEFDEIHFYGAGCTPAKIPVMEDVLRSVFPHAGVIEVSSDLLGAAKSLCGDKEGIACILGTGSNSCLFDGSKIVANVSPMGYILGDEGSGAVIGKTFLGEMYKGNHREMVDVFEKETGYSQADIIQKVYREPLPNRFLASLSVFIASHKGEYAWLQEMLIDCFRLFFRRNIVHYNRPDLPVNFVGSIAFYYAEEIKKAAALEGFTVGVVKKEPFEFS